MNTFDCYSSIDYVHGLHQNSEIEGKKIGKHEGGVLGIDNIFFSTTDITE